MVDVAQLVELRIVIPAVVGSRPIVHPIFLFSSYAGRIDVSIGPLAQLVEQWTLNPLVEGSNPSWPTKRIKELRVKRSSFFIAQVQFRYSKHGAQYLWPQS